MSKENQSGSLTEFAELVLSMAEEERIDMLNKHYKRWEPKLNDFLSGPQLLQRQEPEKSKRSQGKTRGPRKYRKNPKN